MNYHSELAYIVLCKKLDYNRPMLHRYSLRKSGEMYLISIIGQTREIDLNSPPLSIKERLEVRLGQASKNLGTPPDELRKSLEEGATIYWK